MDADGGGRGRRCQRPLRAQVGRSVSGRGRSAVCATAPRRPTVRRRPHRARAGGGDREALRRLRMTAAEIAETLSMPLSTVSVVLRAARGWVGWDGSGSSSQCATSAHGRANSYTSTSRSSAGSRGGAGKRVGGRRPGSYRPRRTDAAGSVTRHHRLGVRPRRRRRSQPPRLRRSAPRRESRNRDRLPPTRACFLPAARASRSNASSPKTAAPTSPPSTPSHAAPRCPPPPHPASPPPNQRQSRTVHPHPAQRLGLRRDLRLQPRTHPSP